MRVMVTYYIGALGPIPRAAFEAELRQQIALEADGLKFELFFNAKPGIGLVASNQQVRCEDGDDGECRDWEEVIGNEILPEVFDRLKTRHAMTGEV